MVKSWLNNGEGLTVFFEHVEDIRKIIYTTNAIESLNKMVHTSLNKHNISLSDQAAFKVSLSSNSTGVQETVNSYP